jgi:hypothetical protein
MSSTLFGKPRDQVVKHPGAFSAKAKAAGKSTSEYANEKSHAGGTLGKQAALAKAFATMRAKKARFGGVFDSQDKPQEKSKPRVRFGGSMCHGGMAK